MSLRPLFTEQELATAFAVLLPRKEAASTAKHWFATMIWPNGVDSAGYYLAEEANWRRTPDSPVNVVALRSKEQQVPTSGGYDKLQSQSVQERIDFLLHLSHFHLYLVMLVSDDVFERIATFLDYDDIKAERARTQMKLIVQVMGVSAD